MLCFLENETLILIHGSNIIIIQIFTHILNKTSIFGIPIDSPKNETFVPKIQTFILLINFLKIKIELVQILPEDLASKFRSKNDLYRLLKYDCKYCSSLIRILIRLLIFF